MTAAGLSGLRAPFFLRRRLFNVENKQTYTYSHFLSQKIAARDLSYILDGYLCNALRGTIKPLKG